VLKKYIFNYVSSIILLFFSLIIINCNVVYAQDNSVSGQLTTLEMQVYSQAYEEEPVIQRLNRLEKDTFGTEKTGAIFSRVDALNREVKVATPQNNPPYSAQPQNQNNSSYQKIPPPRNQYPQANYRNNYNYQGTQPTPGYNQQYTQGGNNQVYTQPPANTYQPPPHVQQTYQKQQGSSKKDYNIPGLESRFDPGMQAKDDLPSHEEK